MVRSKEERVFPISWIAVCHKVINPINIWNFSVVSDIATPIFFRPRPSHPKSPLAFKALSKLLFFQRQRTKDTFIRTGRKILEYTIPMSLNSSDQVKCYLVHGFVAGEWWNSARRSNLHVFRLILVVPFRSNSMSGSPVPPCLLTCTWDNILWLDVEPDRHLTDASISNWPKRNLSSNDDAAAFSCFKDFRGLFFGYLYHLISSDILE
mmetsp:Transcript_16026/g.29064  ORF Transcript_16026/g.29064 Transcript_16026/m.29064 type:complete len:208 (+) Transcript_16026:720-1343(+)